MRHVRPEVLVSEPNGRSRLTVLRLVVWTPAPVPASAGVFGIRTTTQPLPRRSTGVGRFFKRTGQECCETGLKYNQVYMDWRYAWIKLAGLISTVIVLMLVLTLLCYRVCCPCNHSLCTLKTANFGDALTILVPHRTSRPPPPHPPPPSRDTTPLHLFLHLFPF